jgi:aspartate racemase
MSGKVVGIIGGMGPEATVDLMARVIKSTPASDDIDHIHMLVDNNPKVPSRIKALIEQTGESPLPCLQDMACKLADWGADFLAMPCNTAHLYHPGIQEVVKIPLLDMIKLTTSAVIDHHPGLNTVGLLASSAVLKLGLYEKRFAGQDVALISPSVEKQEKVMAAIRKIKSGIYGAEVTDDINTALGDMADSGAQAMIVACTELSIISDALQLPDPCYDASQVLAESIVKFAGEV